MPVPQYFQPDPEVEDADLLGIGEIVYDDGRREFVDDPEIPSLLPVVAAPAPGGTGAFFGGPAPDESAFDASTQRSRPLDTPGGAVSMPTSFSDSSKTAEAGTRILDKVAPGMPGSARAAEVEAREADRTKASEAKNPFLPEGASIDLDGKIQTSSSSAPAEVANPFLPEGTSIDLDGRISDDGLVLAKREGRLDPNVAARQAEDRANQDINTLSATAQSRDSQWVAERQGIREERIRLRARIEEEERVQRESDAKIARLRKEQSDVANADVARDLVSASGGGAAGTIGAVLTILGAALLGAQGSDAGLRAIDSRIDRHVRTQLARKDSRLRALADQIGSEEQVLNQAKVEYYKALEKHSDVMARLTKADAFMAQTPAILEGIRAKQLEYNQAAERESLGKSIEMPLEPGKGIEPERFERYGKVRRERLAAEQMASRGEKEIGLIWDPQKGDYANKAEILSRGVQGKGNLEQWVPNWVYSTFGGVTEEGYQVRGVAESMAYAQIRQMQPTGPISNADIQAAVKAGALDTEEGLIEGLRRIRQQSKTEAQHDAAQFGPEVVEEYERRFRTSGGRDVNRSAAPGGSRTATLEDLNAPQREQRRYASEPDPNNPMGNISAAVQAAAGEELSPEGIQILVAQAAHETDDGKKAPNNNYFGHKQSKARTKAGAPSADLMTTEGAGKNARRVKQTFATFADADESAREHVSLLKRAYPKAWQALQVGDEAAFVAALKDGGYFTGDEGEYLARIQERL